MVPQEEAVHRACAIVGELVLIASALDVQVNHVCISVLALTNSPMLEPIVATIDSPRKIEILRAYAAKIDAPQWRSALKKYVKSVEAVNKSRNIAAHSVISFQDGEAVLTSPAAAKLLKSINLADRTGEKLSFTKLERAIRKAEETLGTGVNLIANFDRVAEERARRHRPRL